MLKFREVDRAVLIDVRLLQDITQELSHLLRRQTSVVRLASQRVHQLLQVSGIKSPVIIEVKDSESVVGLDFQGRRIAEGTQEVQEILKAQAAILHVRGGEDVTYPLPEGVRLQFRKCEDLLHGHPGAVRSTFSALQLREYFVCPKQTH